MSNQLTSTVTITIDGVERRVRFTLGAWAELQDSLGADSLADTLTRVGNGAAEVAKTLVAGLLKDWPEVTEQIVLDSDINHLDAVRAVNKAINLSLFGTETAPRPLVVKAESPSNGVGIEFADGEQAPV